MKSPDRGSDLTWGNIARALEALPDYLAELRDSYGISLRDVRDASGVSLGMLSRFERRQCNVGVDSAIRILHYMDAYGD